MYYQKMLNIIKKHRARVINNYIKLLKSIEYPLVCPTSVDISNHDYTKLDKINHKEIFKGYYKRYVKGIIDERVRIAMYFHVLLEPHHPEYWDPDMSLDKFPEVGEFYPKIPVTPKGMPLLNIIEMVADWMSEAEVHNNTVEYWFERTNEKRYSWEPLVSSLLEERLVPLADIILSKDPDAEFESFKFPL